MGQDKDEVSALGAMILTLHQSRFPMRAGPRERRPGGWSKGSASGLGAHLVRARARSWSALFAARFLRAGALPNPLNSRHFPTEHPEG
jgi:hypothetical protein